LHQHVHKVNFLVLTLEGRNLRGFPGVSGIFPEILGLRAVTALFCVRGEGIKAPSTLSSLSLSCTFRPATLRTHSFLSFTPLDFGLVRFLGDLRRDSEDGFLVEPQNQGRAGTTLEPSHEWRLAEATPSSRGFRWFTRKPLGSLVDP
jgi:hypothetical protein